MSVLDREKPLIRNPATLLDAGWKPLSVIVMVLIIAVAGCGYWYYRAVLADVLADEYEDLSSLASAKVDQLVQWRRERLADVRVLAESPFSRQALEGLVAPADIPDDWLAHLQLSRDAYGYADVFVAGPDKSILGQPDRQEAPEPLRAMEQAMGTGAPVLSDLHYDDAEASRVYVDAVAPVPGRDGPLGVIVLRMDANEYLFPMIRSTRVDSESTEVLFFAYRGDEVVFLSSVRFHEDAPLSLSFPLNRTELPAVQAVLGKRGYFEGVDYRGRDVLADLHEVPASNWYLLAKTDRGELQQTALWQAALIAGLTTLMVVATIMTVAALYRRHQARLYLQLYRSEQEKQESEDLLRIAGRVAGVGGWSVDLSNVDEVIWSPEMFQLYEYPEEEIPDEKIAVPFETAMQFLTPASHDALSEAFERSMRDGEPYDIEIRMTTFKGRDIWIRAIGEAVRDADGSIVRVNGALQEITGQRESARELNEARLLLEKTLDSLNEAVIIVDPAGRTILRCNRVVEQIFGYTPGELTGRSTEMLHVNHESWAEFARVGERELEANGTFLTEYRMKRKDGTIIDTENRVTMLYDEDGWRRGVVSVVRDITERKRAESQREQLQMQLLQSQKMEAIGRLAGGLAHDFNNMLNVILGYTELSLQHLEGDHPVRDDLREVRSAAERSADLTRQLLAFARQQTIAPETVDLNETIASMLNMLGRLIGEQVELVWKPGKNLWQVRVDPSQIDQILANLMVNARDAIADTGWVIIETRNTVLDDDFCQRFSDVVPGDYVMVSVADNGMGMDPEVREQIFEPFFTTKEYGHGTGLGLATVYGIVKQNGGVIDVASERGEGAVFRLYLPRHVDDSKALAGEARRREARTGSETVLLVEDEDALLSLGQRVLERLGYRVLATNRPEEAIRIAREHDGDIHLLLTDVVMPQMNGRDLWREVIALRPDINALFMSGYTEDAIVHHGVLADDVSFIQKPYTAASLGQKIRDVLEG